MMRMNKKKLRKQFFIKLHNLFVIFWHLKLTFFYKLPFDFLHKDFINEKEFVFSIILTKLTFNFTKFRTNNPRRKAF